MAPKPELKAEAIRLRVEERCSLGEISARTGAAKGTLSVWLRPYPLTPEERQSRNNTRGLLITPRKTRGEESKYWCQIDPEQLTRHHKAKIAEAAILFRFVLQGFATFGSVFDGDKADWIVEVPGVAKIWKIQVRWVKRTLRGLPIISLVCYEGHHVQRTFRPEEFDFIVGYDLYTDTAYVYSFAEVAHLKTAVTISAAHAERWDKLRR